MILYFLEDGMNGLLNFSFIFAFDLWNCCCFAIEWLDRTE